MLQEITTRVKPPVAFGRKDYLPAPDLEGLASIAEERAFKHIPQFKVQFLWKKAGGMSKGKARGGMTLKATNLVGFYSNADIVVWLAADNLFDKDAKFIEACLFHELCHIGQDENGELMIYPHDFEGFRAEIARYGLWREDAKIVAPAFRQATF